jgi:hypothetical protein
VSYPIVVKTPERQLDTLSALESLPITAAAGRAACRCSAASAPSPATRPTPWSATTTSPGRIDIYASPHGRDLAGVARDIQKIIDKEQKGAPKGVTITLRGQVDTMNSAFGGLFFGLIGAVVLIYLLIVVNFQSWLDPFVIITALPAALAGIVWMLFATGTTLSVPALTGAIMCMGVATANSILVVSFARERLALHGDPAVAAVEAGFTRFRPVLMTALAMIIGMAPMALGLGEGGEQNAPLGRAVIGGLIFATVATLMFVPVVFSLVHGIAGSPGPPTTLMPSPEKRMQPPSNREILRYEPPRGLRLALIVIGGVLALAVVAGILARVNASQDRKQAIADMTAVPTVELVAVKADTAARDAGPCPADVQPFNNATTYARVSGYLKRWAPTSAPGAPRPAAGGGSTRRTSTSSSPACAPTSTPPWPASPVGQHRGALERPAGGRRRLKQEYDEKAADLAVKTSLVAAARANLAQLEATAGFKRVVAPFDGVVTQRAPTSAAWSRPASAGAPLYTDRRCAPPAHLCARAAELHPADPPGMAAKLLAPERPNDVFVATVVNDAQAISAQSGPCWCSCRSTTPTGG